MKILLIFILLLVSACAFSQSTLPLRADTVVIEKIGGNAELKLKNKTKDTLGVLTNMGNGVTSFIKSKRYRDTCVIIGRDTICGLGGGGSYAGPFNAPATGFSLVNTDKEIKKLVATYGIARDSTGTTITDKIDTTGPLSLVPQERLRDTAAAIRAAFSNNALNVPTFFGIMYNKNSWTNLSDFTNTLTAAVVANKINISSGAGTFTQTLRLNQITYSEYWTVCAKVRITASGGTAYGMGLGMQSTNGLYPVSILGAMDFTNTGTAGVSSLTTIQGGVPTVIATSGANLAFSVNDYVLIMTQRKADTVTVSVKNASTNSAWIRTSYVYKLDGSVTAQVPNTGAFAIYSFGGTFTIDSLAVNDNEINNADYALVGDSKTAGGKASEWANRWGDKFQALYPSTINLGGNADRLIELLTRTSDVIARNPKTILMNMGSNDIRSSRDSVDYNADYDTCVNRFTAAGIRVIHLLTFYETSQNNMPLVRHVRNTYAAVDIIDTYSPLQTTSDVLDGDGIHLNDAGHDLVLQTIRQSGKANPYGSNLVNVIRRSIPATVDTSSGGGGSATPGGSNTQLQYNNSGAFAGTSGMVWDATNTRIGLGKTGPTTRLDIQANVNAADGVLMTNTNAGSSARSFFRLVNDASELGELTIFSSNHTTLPNYAFFAASKSFRIGVDAGIASGGTSKFEVVTGGYSSTPSLTVNGSGNTLVNTSTDNSIGTMQVAGKLGLMQNSAAVNNLIGLYNTNAGNYSASTLSFYNDAGTNVTSDGARLVYYSAATDAPYANSFMLQNQETGPIMFWGSSSEYGRFNSNGNFLVGSNSDNGARLQITGKSSFSDTGSLAAKFSYNTNIGSSFTRYSLVDKNYVDSAVATVSGGGDGDGIYGGSGTLPSDVTVTGGSNDLAFLALDQLRFNMNTMVQSKNDGTRPFTSTISGTGSNWKFAYTPTAGTYSKGDGLQVDSNNNVIIGSGTTVPSTPLYATGNSLFANGIQNNGGLFLRISNVSSSLSLPLTSYCILVNATSGNITITLPAASSAEGAGIGIQYLIKRMDNSGNTITIQRAGSDTIDGGTSFSLTTQYESKQIMAISNTQWALF